MTTNGLPRDTVLERHILGAMLLDPKCHATAAEHIKADPFYDIRNETIWSCMLELDAAGEPVNFTTVRAALKASGRLEKAGGGEYVVGLTKNVIAAQTTTVRSAKRLSDIASQRAMIRVAMSITADGMEEIEDVPAYLASSYDAVSAVLDSRPTATESVTLGQSAWEAMEDIRKQRERGSKILGFPSGLTRLDESLSGFERGVVYVLCGRPGMGKTAMAQAIALGISKHAPVLACSFEMPHKQWSRRWLASEGGISGNTMRNIDRLTDYDIAKLTQTKNDFSKVPIELVDRRGSILDVRQHARRVKRERGDLGMVVIDYLQLMRPVKRDPSREREVGEMSAETKGMAVDLDVAVLLLCQLNRGCESRDDKRPRLPDLRESGTIEQDADDVLALYREEYYVDEVADKDKGVCEVGILKQRKGPTGRIRVFYDAERTRFGNLEIRNE